MLDKNTNRIKTLLATRVKRRQQCCKVVELKISNNHLNKTEKEQLRMFFLEAKWLYNYVLSKNDPFHYDYRENPIKKMNKNKEFEGVELKYLPAKNKQTVVQILQQNIKNLHSRKKRDLKVGRLKFKSNYNSIDLNQYGVSHKIVGERFKINGIKRALKVYGLEQIKPDYEFANAKLIKSPGGYFIKLTCFYFPKGDINYEVKKDIGIDFGCKNTLTTSEGEVINISIEESERLKKIQRRIFKSKKG